jgi:hypothetical protein
VYTAGYILQGDVRTKVKTPGTGKIMVEEAVQTSTWRGCANSHYIPVQDSCLVSNKLCSFSLQSGKLETQKEPMSSSKASRQEEICLTQRKISLYDSGVYPIG